MMKKIIIVSCIVIILAAAGISIYCFCNRITATEDEKAALVKGNNEFALSLYGELANSYEGKNLFFSPYSISNALAMTYAGARGETEKQMKETLHFSLEQERLHPAIFVLRRELLKNSKKSSKLDIANALYAQTDEKFHNDFLKLIRKYYNANFARADFKGNPDAAVSEINKWIIKETKGKIPTIIARENITADTMLVLLNAIYFKGGWESKFHKEDTYEEAFHLADGTEKAVPMMHQMGKFICIGFDSGEKYFRMLEMPYVGGNISMIIFLLESKNDLSLLEKAMDAKNLQNWLSELKNGASDVHIAIPKFKFGTRYFLEENLKNMGIKNAFELKLADFSLTSPTKLFISFVLHRAYIEVDEEGTTAAAATAVSEEKIYMLNDFVADHPFMFIIRDNKTGCILFMGRVMDPTEEDVR
jgi:serpin B